MELLKYDDIDEKVYYEKLKNGLEVYLLPKRDYNKMYATFSTKYGSLDNTFKTNDKEEYVDFPEGIAHFLEHKMFEMEDGDAFMKLSMMGASSNAFTSYSKTTYLFSTTTNQEEALCYLLDFVQTPYFTDENVEKEKGIIAQEILMYDDYPDFRCQMGLLKNMYEKHPIRVDIVGTVDSINQITKEMLYTCYETFYHPSNMQLFVIGNFDLESMLKKITMNQNEKEFKEYAPIKKEFILEDPKVITKYGCEKMAVVAPKFCLGLKLPMEKRNSLEQMKYELSISILLSLLLGESSDYYEELLNNGLINESFEISGNHEEMLDFIMATAETDFPDELGKRLTSILLSVPSFKINEEDFTRVKRALMGNFTDLFNSLEGIANYFTRFNFMGMDFFTIVKEIASLTIKDLENLKPHFKEEAISIFVILPEDN